MQPKKAGRKSWVSRCPFHEDKTPSLKITPEKGQWYCFGCGRGGDGIALTQTTLGLSFEEAIWKITS